MRTPRELSRRDRPRTTDRLTGAAPPGGRRGTLFALVGAGALALGVAALIGNAAGYGRLLHSLRSADATWLMAGLPAEALAYVGYTLAFRAAAALDGGPRLRLPVSARVVVASIGATRLILAGGPGYLYWALRRTGLGKTGAVARLAALNGLLFGFLGALAWLASLLVVLGPVGPVPRALALPWLIGVAAAGGGLLVAANFVRLGLPTKRAAAVLGLLLRHPARHVPAYVGAVLYWTGDILCLWLALRAFDARPAFTALVLAYATSYFATMLPLPLGGAGGGEAAITLALTAVGVPLAPALLGVLAYRLFSFWLPTLPGLALLASGPWVARELAQPGRGATATGRGSTGGDVQRAEDADRPLRR